MIDCDTITCKDNAVLTYKSKLGVDSYRKFYCADCYIKLMGWDKDATPINTGVNEVNNLIARN